jgi:hypothetical protein
MTPSHREELILSHMPQVKLLAVVSPSATFALRRRSVFR